MRKGMDRTRAPIPSGTRHLCPYCEWYLDMEPLPRLEGFNFLGLMDALNRRLDAIDNAMANHLKTDHPQEFAAAINESLLVRKEKR